MDILESYRARSVPKEMAFSEVEYRGRLARVRAVKSPAELECLRQAGRFSVAAMEAAVRAMRPGVTENGIAAAAVAAMIEAGSEFFCTDPWVRAGHRSGIIHATYKRHFVKLGDPVIIELGGVYQRYTAPLYATAVIGRPSPARRRWWATRSM